VLHSYGCVDTAEEDMPRNGMFGYIKWNIGKRVAVLSGKYDVRYRYRYMMCDDIWVCKVGEDYKWST